MQSHDILVLIVFNDNLLEVVDVVDNVGDKILSVGDNIGIYNSKADIDEVEQVGDNRVVPLAGDNNERSVDELVGDINKEEFLGEVRSSVTPKSISSTLSTLSMVAI